VQLNQVSQIAIVSRFDGLDVWAANHAGIDDDFIGPSDNRLIILFEPNIGQQSRPSSIAVLKRTDLHGTMMPPCGLFDAFYKAAISKFLSQTSQIRILLRWLAFVPTR
jgi:hypothetical protein